MRKISPESGLTVSRRSTKYPERHRCGYCGGEYDVGPPAVIGEFYYWPDGGKAYSQHSREAHGTVGKHGTACDGECAWLCSACGKERRYRSVGKRHGGPPVRLLDRRYGLDYCDGSSYPSHKRAFGRIDGARGPVVFYHEGAPNPTQPKQTDPKIKEIAKKYEKDTAKQTSKRSGNNKGDKTPVPKTRDRTSGDSVLVTRRRKD